MIMIRHLDGLHHHIMEENSQKPGGMLWFRIYQNIQYSLGQRTTVLDYDKISANTAN